jgi:alpha-tubulin suppressor-like RCC1 family protein
MTRRCRQSGDRALGFVALGVLLGALGGCKSASDRVGTVSLELRKDVDGVAYRLRDGVFSVLLVGSTTPVDTIQTEANPDATSIQRSLAPGNYNVNLASGWRLEKQTTTGFTNVGAQLVSQNPAVVTIVDGQITETAFAFQTDGGVTVVIGNGTLSLAIDVLDQSRLPAVTQLALGQAHTCARFATGAVRCWGDGADGRLGYGNTTSIGDSETPAVAGDVNVGGSVTQLAAGAFHTCALLSTGNVRCWGFGNSGPLGYGNTTTIGDNETPASAGDVPVGGTVTQITAGTEHTCALLSTGNVRCWGDNSGQLGYGHINRIGDDETPASVGDVPIGGPVVQIEAGGSHTCARLTSGAVRCWGIADSGQLGYGNTIRVGAVGTPAAAGDVPIGGTAVQIVAGANHTCALLSTGAIRCWGENATGQLGRGGGPNIGDDERPDSVPAFIPSPLGTSPFIVAELMAGANHNCVRSGGTTDTTGFLRCWGDNFYGQLGYGHTSTVNTLPGILGVVQLGPSKAASIAGGTDHTCAALQTGAVRCWGRGESGQLGYGNIANIGDNETPATLGNVVVVTQHAPSTGAGGNSGAAGTGGAAGTSGAAGTGTGGTGTFGRGGTTGSGGTTGTGGGGVMPTFVGAGSGVDGFASVTVPYPTGLQANDLLVLQIGSRTVNTTPTTAPAGFSHFDPGEAASPNAYQRLYYKFAAGSETGTLTVNLDNPATLGSTHVAVGRFYAFRGVALSAFTESPTFASDTDGTLTGPTITTTGPRRLAVAFTSLDSNPLMAPFVGETGGDWNEPVPEFLSGMGSNFGIQLQIAPMPTAGTLTGGQADFGGSSDAMICRAFALKGL